jgi:hypothetical protein
MNGGEPGDPTAFAVLADRPALLRQFTSQTSVMGHILVGSALSITYLLYPQPLPNLRTP